MLDTVLGPFEVEFPERDPDTGAPEADAGPAVTEDPGGAAAGVLDGGAAGAAGGGEF